MMSQMGHLQTSRERDKPAHAGQCAIISGTSKRKVAGKDFGDLDEGCYNLQALDYFASAGVAVAGPSPATRIRASSSFAP
jgi:hypothetical protein